MSDVVGALLSHITSGRPESPPGDCRLGIEKMAHRSAPLGTEKGIQGTWVFRRALCSLVNVEPLP